MSEPTSAAEDSELSAIQTSVRERLMRRTVVDGDCLIWQGAIRDSGYGVIGIWQGGRNTVKSTHRVAYEAFIGPIPEGLHLDHLCGNRACVNPAHLEAVTQQENNRRAALVRVANKPECKYGHPFTPENTFPGSAGGRQCRTCHNLRPRARRRGMTIGQLVEKETSGHREES